MILEYGSVMYFVYLFLSLAFCMILYFIFRNKSIKTKKTCILVILFLNLFQHIFKGLIYPMYWGNYSIHFSSAYNVCAFLIIVSPFIFLSKNELLKNYITFIGTAAGLVAMLIPYWDIGQNAFSWEIYRFYICHSLLMSGSILPVLFGLHKMNYKHFWKIGIVFFASLLIITINNVFFIKIGQYPVNNPSNMYEALCEINPCWSIRPPDGFGFVVKIIEFFTPSFFSGNNPFGIPLPFLWYFIPMYILMTAGSFIIYLMIDKKNIKSDIEELKNKINE